MVGYYSTTYNKKGVITSGLAIYSNYSYASVVKIQYRYANNQLGSYKEITKTYDVENFDIQHFIKKTKKPNDQPKETLETSGTYEYDTLGRCVAHNIVKPQESTEISYKVNYLKNETTISTSVNGKLDKFSEYSFDNHKNPVQVNDYVFINNKKYLEMSTTLNITYFD